MNQHQPQSWFSFEGREAREARLRNEIADFNEILDRIEREDLELAEGIRNNPDDHDLMSKNTESLAVNSRAAIENKREIADRAEKLRIKFDEARKITNKE